MSFTRRLMAQGDFTVPLRPNTPRWIRRITKISTDDGHGFNAVICTPCRFSIDDLDPDDLLDEADFVGIHRSNDGLNMTGAGIEVLVSDEYGKGPFNPTASATQTFASWISDLASSNLAISTGSVETISGNVTWDPGKPQATIESLNYICRAKGAEWRINNDLTLDAGTISYLYSTTPRAIVGAVGRGGLEPGGYRGVVGKVGLVEHVEDYARGAWYYDGAGSDHLEQRATQPYREPISGGSTAIPIVHLVDTSATPWDLTSLAIARLVYGDDVLKRIYRVEGLGTNRPLEHIGVPGEYLYIFDPAELLFDKTNQIVYRGGPVWPIKLRIISVTTPLRRGQGWYYRYWTGSGSTMATIDITDHIDWAAEAGVQPAVEVGQPSQSWVNANRDRYEDWLTNR